MKTFLQSPNLEIAQLEDEWVVLNINRSTMTKLNQTGGYILSLLTQAQTVDQLMASLGEFFEQMDDSAKRQVEEYLRLLLDIQLIEQTPLSR